MFDLIIFDNFFFFLLRCCKMPVGLDKVLIQFYTLFYLFNLSYEDLIMPIKIHRIYILKLHGIP